MNSKNMAANSSIYFLFYRRWKSFHPKDPEGKVAICGEVLIWKNGVTGSENTKGNISNKEYKFLKGKEAAKFWYKVNTPEMK